MKKGKEQIDISQLPQVSQTITSIIFNFETTDKKLKIIESFYKMPEKELKLISREEIILFAKDQKIYIDPAEGKKPAKGEPPIEHKPITAQELAKAAKLLIEENSVQFRKNKKDLLDNISFSEINITVNDSYKSINLSSFLNESDRSYQAIKDDLDL